MGKRLRAALTVALLCGLLPVLSGAGGLPGAILGNGTPTIEWYVIGSGGGVRDHPAPYTLDCTIGQAVVGTATEAGSELCSGFWCWSAVEYAIYLPLLLRNAS